VKPRRSGVSWESIKYRELGLQGLLDRSRRPYRHANRLPFQVESTIVTLRQERPTWGAVKIREKLIRDFPMVPTPAKSTVHAVLDRHGLVEPRKRRRTGHPQQNGRHERIHLTLKKEATRPASHNFLQQQHRFDEFLEVYNTQRPHQALKGRYPAELFTPSPRPYKVPDPPEYPFHDRTVRVTQCGRICIGKRKINLSIVFAGQFVGIREVADKIWLVSFLDFDLGFFDEAAARVEPGANPFASKVLTMSPV
jgi:homeodomain-containing protein/integrase-like protein